MHATLGAAGRPGPVHLNFPLREPLVAPARPARRAGAGATTASRGCARRRAPARAADLLRRGWRRHPHGVVVAGRAEREQPALAEALARFAGAAGWPLLADPLSWARRGSAAIAHYDALLRCDVIRHPRPTAVLRVGDLPTSKPLRAWLAGLDAEQIAFEPEGVWHDPDATLCRGARRRSVATLDALASA